MKFSHFLAFVLSFSSFVGLVLPVGLLEEHQMLSFVPSVDADTTGEYSYHGASNKSGAVETTTIFRNAPALFLQNGTKLRISGKASESEVLACVEAISSAFPILPPEHLAALKTLVLEFNPLAKRGLGGQTVIRIRCTGMPKNEIRNVFIHEIGHIVDTGLLDGSSESSESPFLDGSRPVFQDDPSLGFYELSFIDSDSLRDGAKSQNFVSGYAKSDVFEDFAESYTYYIVRGAEFRFLGRFYPVLEAKYAFLRDEVFTGREYGSEEFSGTVDVAKRVFDVTRLSQ